MAELARPDNPLVLSLIDSIVGLLREQRLRIFNVKGGPGRGQIHHKRILAAVEHGQEQDAREAMRAHLQQVSEDSNEARTDDPPAEFAAGI